MSSIPFITAAQMATNPWEKGVWYAGSLLGPLSRVNDDAHYSSQVMLGWLISYVAVSAVSRTEALPSAWAIQPVVGPAGAGVLAEYRW